MFFFTERVILPATGYLWLVWETFAIMMGVDITELAVTFEAIRLKKAIIFKNDDVVQLTIQIHRSKSSTKDGSFCKIPRNLIEP